MALENILGNMVRGIAVVSSLYMAGCGTTIRTPVHTPQGEIWYDCNTNEDYPQRHPCYAQVKAYNARMAASSPPTTSSPRNFSGMGAQERREFYGGEPREKGHWECPR